jgi:hypothetical protein
MTRYGTSGKRTAALRQNRTSRRDAIDLDQSQAMSDFVIRNSTLMEAWFLVIEWRLHMKSN